MLTSPEYSQPEGLDISPLKGEMGWAYQPRIYVEWLKHIAPQFGLDIDKLILAQSYLVVQDDGNNLRWPSALPFSPDWAKKYRQMYLIRLDWEINESTLPEDLKGRLKLIKEKIDQQEWDSLDKMNEIGQKWKEVETEVTVQMNTNSETREALKEHHRARPILEKPQEEFFTSQ